MTHLIMKKNFKKLVTANSKHYEFTVQFPCNSIFAHICSLSLIFTNFLYVYNYINDQIRQDSKKHKN